MTPDPENRPSGDLTDRQESRAELERERQARVARTLSQARPGTGAGLRRKRESASVGYDLWDNVPI